MTDVIKRSGTRQAFRMAKLERSIERAARDAHVSTAQRKKFTHEIAHHLYHDIKQRSAISSTELRQRVLRRLASRSPATVKSWQRYDRRTR